MKANFFQRLAVFLITLSILTACGSQTSAVQIVTPLPSSNATKTSAPVPTPTVIPSQITSATPCLGLIATPVSTPKPWSSSDDYWNKIAVSRISIKDAVCAAPEEIVRKLVLQWLETIKMDSPGQPCGMEEYELGSIAIQQNTITPRYDIVARVVYRVKTGRFEGCGWLSDGGQIEDGGWIKVGDPFGVYRENGDFRLIILPGWGT